MNTKNNTTPKDSTDSSAVKGRMQRLVSCDSCESPYPPDELNTVDAEEYGEHTTIEICDECMNCEPLKPKYSPFDDSEGYHRSFIS